MSTEIKLVLKKQEIEDFLRYTFSKKKGPIPINRSCDIGRVICAMVSTSSLPKPMTFHPDENVIRLILPSSRKSTDYKYVYFTREDMVRINDFLQASFNLFFKSFMLAGDVLDFEQKDLLESFLSCTGIRDVGKKYETLKKKDYRQRKNIHKIVVKSLESIGLQSIKK